MRVLSHTCGKSTPRVHPQLAPRCIILQSLPLLGAVPLPCRHMGVFLAILHIYFLLILPSVGPEVHARLQNKGWALHRLWFRHLFKAKTLLGEPRLTGAPVAEWTITKVHEEHFITTTTTYSKEAPKACVSTRHPPPKLVNRQMFKTFSTTTFTKVSSYLQLQKGTFSTVTAITKETPTCPWSPLAQSLQIF